jgi:hypothetical protein
MRLDRGRNAAIRGDQQQHSLHLRRRAAGRQRAPCMHPKLRRRHAARIGQGLQLKPGSPALTAVRRYYGAHEELFEVTVTTHPEGRYTYSMDMQRSLRPRV